MSPSGSDWLRELGGGRRIIFRCNFAALCAGSVAVTRQGFEPNVMNLCAPFWHPPARLRGLPPVNFRAGTIIHEVLHILFFEFFHHFGTFPTDPLEMRRDNANCYEAFAYRVNGFGADDVAVTLCVGRPA